MPNKRWGGGGEREGQNKWGRGSGSNIFLVNGGVRNFKKSANICNESKKETYIFSIDAQS